MLEKKDEWLKKIYNFFQLESKNSFGDFVSEVRQACISRLCMSIGVKDCSQFQSEFFEFFSAILGQAVCDYFKINCAIAGAELRFVRHEGINIVNEVVKLFQTQEVDEAVIDAFEIIDRFKYLVQKN